MENCNSRSYSQTRKGPDSGGKFPPDRAPSHSRQSSRENYIKQDCTTMWYKNNILIPEQHGFRPDLSTTHQLLRVVETIKSGFKNKKSTGAVFLDIQKAFDRVWREGLIFKLIKYDFPPPLIKLISSYLTDRNFSVKINDTYSSHRPTEAGVAQGTLISPLLFNIYVNDIPIHHNTTLCMFADDTAILASHTEPKLVARAINRHLLVLEDWFSKWKIALNVAKTEAVFFTRKTRLNYPDIYLHNERIPGLRAPNTLVLRWIKTHFQTTYYTHT
ncbi:probable RNA-directed DNA polymerase from transposon BS [Trichonephila clavipes]|nr:probable RNA-directed DNA polymerase from transposon BS [Trichonephila clavipes]